MCRGVASIAETKAFIQEVIEKMRERSSKERGVRKGKGNARLHRQNIYFTMKA
jgi:hypothetical protein